MTIREIIGEERELLSVKLAQQFRLAVEYMNEQECRNRCSL